MIEQLRDTLSFNRISRETILMHTYFCVLTCLYYIKMWTVELSCKCVVLLNTASYFHWSKKSTLIGHESDPLTQARPHQTQYYGYCVWFINLLPHLTVEDRTAGGGWDGKGMGGREHGGAGFRRARRRMANSGGAKGQAVLIGIPDMLHCVPVPVPFEEPPSLQSSHATSE